MDWKLISGLDDILEEKKEVQDAETTSMIPLGFNQQKSTLTAPGEFLQDISSPYQRKPA